MIDKLDLIKIKKLHSVQDAIKGVRRYATDWEKILEKDTSDKGLLSKIQRT